MLNQGAGLPVLVREVHAREVSVERELVGLPAEEEDVVTGPRLVQHKTFQVCAKPHNVHRQVLSLYLTLQHSTIQTCTDKNSQACFEMVALDTYFHRFLVK